MIGIIDASALLRLFLQDGSPPDGLQELLSETEKGNSRALAPQLLLVESANVLRKKQKNQLISEIEAYEMLNEFKQLGIEFVDDQLLIENALRLAIKWGLTVYDALYLELAYKEKGVLFTCDIKLNTVAKQLALH